MFRKSFHFTVLSLPSLRSYTCFFVLSNIHENEGEIRDTFLHNPRQDAFEFLTMASRFDIRSQEKNQSTLILGNPRLHLYLNLARININFSPEFDVNCCNYDCDRKPGFAEDKSTRFTPKSDFLSFVACGQTLGIQPTLKIE